MEEKQATDLVKYMKAILAVQLRSQDKSEIQEKPEILLSGIGLSPREIAGVLGKSPDAVKKTIQRAGKK
jgi:DNA-directed RNA polymerase specialized sigma24 family protein